MPRLPAKETRQAASIIFVQEARDRRSQDRAYPHIEHPSQRQHARDRRPGRLREVARKSRAESNDHPDLDCCLWSSASGGASPRVKIRDENRHYEDQHNPDWSEKRIARFLQEQSLFLHGFVKRSQSPSNKEAPCDPHHSAGNASQPYPSRIQLHCAPVSVWLKSAQVYSIRSNTVAPWLQVITGALSESRSVRRRDYSDSLANLNNCKGKIHNPDVGEPLF